MATCSSASLKIWKATSYRRCDGQRSRFSCRAGGQRFHEQALHLGREAGFQRQREAVAPFLVHHLAQDACPGRAPHACAHVERRPCTNAG